MSQRKRNPWTTTEDHILLCLVDCQGPRNWAHISLAIEARTAKQCRERYTNILRPGLNHSPISPEEGARIENLVASIGKRWAMIARQLSGRSENAVKNWWNIRTKRGNRSQGAGQQKLRDQRSAQQSIRTISPSRNEIGLQWPTTRVCQQPPHQFRMNCPQLYQQPPTYLEQAWAPPNARTLPNSSFEWSSPSALSHLQMFPSSPPSECCEQLLPSGCVASHGQVSFFSNSQITGI